ncbi:MAG: hypothetical protein HY075_10755 [Deltaproteobacteria bacterium]|nr:hypothetical protein [Deltaproteobacteria bacterium]
MSVALAAIALAVASPALAAPCCSGSALMPALITTDSNAQLSARASQSTIVGSSHADGSSVFNRDGNDESATTFLMSGAYALDPRWQLHAEVPVSRRYRGIDATKLAHWGAGDVSVGTAFEAIQELRYNLYKPRVWIFGDLTAPTGRSIQESQSVLAADVHGRGAWGATLGALALKTWKSVDAYAMAQHRRYLPRGGLTLGPATALEAGAGYNLGDYRFGASLGPTWEGAVAATGGVSSTEAKLVWTAGFQASTVLQELWSLTLSYADQTLLGPTYNSPLSRSATLMATRRFE